MGLRRSAKRIHVDQRGAQLVEFAILAPLLFLLLFGIIEVGRFINTYATIWGAARDGARELTVETSYYDCDAIRNAALRTTGGIGGETVAVQYSVGAGISCPVAGNLTQAQANQIGTALKNGGVLASVTVSAPFSPVVKLVPLQPITISSTQTRTIYVDEKIES